MISKQGKADLRISTVINNTFLLPIYQFETITNKSDIVKSVLFIVIRIRNTIIIIAHTRSQSVQVVSKFTKIF